MIATIAHILIEYKEALFRGLLVTGALCAIIWSVGLVFGTLCGVAAHRYPGPRTGLKWFGFLLSSVPFLVFLFWLHYPLQEMLGVVWPAFFTAALSLSILNATLVAQIVRDTLDQFPQQYAIAGIACGLSQKEILTKIQFPIVLRALIPQLLSTQVLMLQMTVFASLISTQDLFRVAQQINAIIYKPIEIYTTLALFFIAICLPVNILAAHLKSRYTRNLSES